MLVEDFRRRFESVNRMTVDFVSAVPDDKWDYSPDPPGRVTREKDPLRHGEGFAPFCKQLRHVVCVRGVYAAAMTSGRVDFSKKHAHYTGDLTRGMLFAALVEKADEILSVLESVDVSAPIDFLGDRSVLATSRSPSSSMKRSIKGNEHLCRVGGFPDSRALAEGVGSLKDRQSEEAKPRSSL